MDSIDKVVAADSKLGPEDMESLKGPGQNLCEDKPLPAYWEHVERWQDLAVRARELYVADPTRVIFSEWQNLTAWYLRSRDALIEISSEEPVTLDGV